MNSSLDDAFSRDFAAGNINPKDGKKVNSYPLLIKVKTILEVIKLYLLRFSFAHIMGQPVLNDNLRFIL